MNTTESPDQRHPELDRYPSQQLVAVLIDDQLQAVAAVQAAAPQIAAAVDAAAERLARGGRLLYVGAGTSGRLALLDSVELWPTFSWPPKRAIALLAGGEQALWRAVEGAEDNTERGRADLAALQPGADDVVIGIAASGTTPYVLGALQAGRAAGALTIGIANNPDAAVTANAELGITLATGSEVISGSTRLKAGTAQKICLNTLSSAIMVRLDKVHGNLMVDLQATNAKLRRRAEALTARLTGAEPEAVRAALMACAYRVKPATLVLRCGLDAQAALDRLAACGGNLRRALASQASVD